MAHQDTGRESVFVNAKKKGKKNEHLWNRWNASHFPRRQIRLRSHPERGMPEQAEERHPQRARPLRHLPEHQTAVHRTGQERGLVAPTKYNEYTHLYQGRLIEHRFLGNRLPAFYRAGMARANEAHQIQLEIRNLQGPRKEQLFHMRFKGVQ